MNIIFTLIIMVTQKLDAFKTHCISMAYYCNGINICDDEFDCFLNIPVFSFQTYLCNNIDVLYYWMQLTSYYKVLSGVLFLLSYYEDITVYIFLLAWHKRLRLYQLLLIRQVCAFGFKFYKFIPIIFDINPFWLCNSMRIIFRKGFPVFNINTITKIIFLWGFLYIYLLNLWFIFVF